MFMESEVIRINVELPSREDVKHIIMGQRGTFDEQQVDKFLDGVFLLLPYTKITIFQLLKQMVKNKIYQTQYDT